MSNDHTDDILELIEETADRKDRAILLILYRISTSLEENTSTTRTLEKSFRAHKEEFNAHVETITARRSEDKGVMRVLPWVMRTAQALIIGAFLYIYNDVQALKGHFTSVFLEFSVARAEILGKINGLSVDIKHLQSIQETQLGVHHE